MDIKFHPHAQRRMLERGATKDEVADTLERGEKIAAKFDRFAFRKNFVFDAQWSGKHYQNKQIEVYAVNESGGWIIITVLVKYF